MIRSVRHIGIVVNRIDEILPFYKELLGLRIVKRTSEPGPFINTLLNLNHCQLVTIKLETHDGGTLIELLEFKSHQSTGAEKPEIFSTGLSHIALTVHDLDTTYARLQSAGIVFFSPPLISPDGCAKVAFCRDPSGNCLELVEELKSPQTGLD